MPQESIDVTINVGSGADDKEEMRSRLSEIFAASGRNTRIALAPLSLPVLVPPAQETQ